MSDANRTNGRHANGSVARAARAEGGGAGTMSARSRSSTGRSRRSGCSSCAADAPRRSKVDIYEVKLGDEFLMSSMFTVAEVAIARLALAEATGTDLDVVVGGLGPRLHRRRRRWGTRGWSVHVVEALAEVIEWHRDHVLPLAARPTDDPRCRRDRDDFFAPRPAAAGLGPPSPTGPMRCWSTSTTRRATCSSRATRPFYQADGLRRLADSSVPAACSRCGPTVPPTRTSSRCSTRCSSRPFAHEVTFPNFYTDGESTSAVYVA